MKGGILGKRRKQHKVEDLSRLLVYILGHRPFEFGLVPEASGFVSFKELLKAVHEEPGWGFVRTTHINEILMGKDRGLFELDGSKIRAVDRRWEMDLEAPLTSLPKILFAPIRQRAHSPVLENGLNPGLNGILALTDEKDMALRIGTRKDKDPVLIEVKAAAAAGKGVDFYSFGSLFLCFRIPPDFIAGPLLPKETLQAAAKEKKAPPEAKKPSSGTFVLESKADPDLSRRAKGRKPKGWKEKARKMRKEKGK